MVQGVICHLMHALVSLCSRHAFGASEMVFMTNPLTRIRILQQHGPDDEIWGGWLGEISHEYLNRPVELLTSPSHPDSPQ